MITVNYDLSHSIDTLSYTGYNPEKCVFFDIETTGFSVRNTHVYLIGVIYYDSNIWKSIQWFANSTDDEKELLYNFFKFIKNYQVLIHFNGEGFDIPYLSQKADLHKITCCFDKMISIDIFKAVSYFKKYLKLENYKQKTIEKFLDIHRSDIYSGGELINVYANYQKTNDTKAYELLLLHNQEDIVGMTGLLPMLSYTRILEGGFEFESCEENENEVIFICRLSFALPKRVSLGYKDYYITAYGNTLKIRIKICSDELKYFYKNYQDYYYLPAEDMAIHKSVATYVDKEFRTRAKASNCYIRKTGRFIPQCTEVIIPHFRTEYNNKVMYIELNDDFMGNSQLIHHYLLDIIKAV